MNDIFEEKNILPMLLEQSEPFDDENYIYELKFDGIRCLAYLNNEQTILRNRRNKDVTNLYPELSDIHKQIKEKCILDGELISVKNGKPNFFELQKRSLMGNKFKIELSAKLNPIQFVAYDILYLKNEEVTDLPQIKRKELLQNNITENNRIVISRFIFKNGIDFFNLAKQNELEGVVAKEKNSKYYIGKRSNNWLKMKVLQEEDLVICGYTEESNKLKDLIMGYYDNNQLIYRVSIYSGGNKKLYQTLSKQIKNDTPHFDIKNVTWIKPNLVGTVCYMQLTKNNGLRQPFFKGLRNDKNPQNCSL